MIRKIAAGREPGGDLNPSGNADGTGDQGL